MLRRDTLHCYQAHISGQLIPQASSTHTPIAGKLNHPAQVAHTLHVHDISHDTRSKRLSGDVPSMTGRNW